MEVDDGIEVLERTRGSRTTPDAAGPGATAALPSGPVGRQVAAIPAIAMQLQRTAGNAAVGRLLRRDPLPAVEDDPTAESGAEPPTAADRGTSTVTAAADGGTPPGPPDSPADGGAPPSPTTDPVAGTVDPGSGAGGASAGRTGAAGGSPSGGTPGTGGADGGGVDSEGPDGGMPTPRAEAPPTPAHDPAAPPTPANPTPWESSISDPVNTARAILEVTRPFPVVGLFTGLVADGINAKQDLDAIDGADAPYTRTTIIIRNGVNIVNNAIGAIAGITQLIEDAATGSVVLAEADVVLVPFHEAVKGVKIFVDGVLIGLDAVVGAEAEWQLQHTNPTDAAGMARWQGVIGNYLGNIVGDGLTLTVDMIDEATGGFANGENIKRVATAADNAWEFIKYLRNVLTGWWGVYGGSLLTPTSGPSAAGTGAPAGSATAPANRSIDAAAVGSVGPIRREPVEGTGGMSDALRASALQVVLDDIAGFRSVHAQADAFIQSTPDVVNQMYANADAWIAQLTGGAPLTERIHQITNDATVRITESINGLVRMGAMGTTAGEKAAWINEQASAVLAAIDSLAIPDMHIPHADEDTIGSSVVNAGADLADRGLQAALDTARSGLDAGKEMLRTPVVSVQTSAQDVADFAQILQQHVQNATAQLTQRLAEFNAGVSRCQNGTDFINLLIDQISAASGQDLRATIDGLMHEWHQVPVLLDQAEEWAHATFGPRPSLPGDDAGELLGTAAADGPPPDAPDDVTSTGS